MNLSKYIKSSLTVIASLLLYSCSASEREKIGVLKPVMILSDMLIFTRKMGLIYQRHRKQRISQ